MSQAGELAARILKRLAARRIVPLPEQMHLRYLARPDEVTLPIEEIARRILSRERDEPRRARVAGQG